MNERRLQLLHPDVSKQAASGETLWVEEIEKGGKVRVGVVIATECKG